MEPGNKSPISGYDLVAVELPVEHQTVCVNHENDLFLCVHTRRFYFSR
jgi:hypothetical protein